MCVCVHVCVCVCVCVCPCVCVCVRFYVFVNTWSERLLLNYFFFLIASSTYVLCEMKNKGLFFECSCLPVLYE